MKNKMLIVCAHAKSPQLCSTLCDPMDCSPPGSSVHGILQARILEWVTMPSSGSSDPGIKPTSLMFPVLAVAKSVSECEIKQIIYVLILYVRQIF